MFPIVADTNVVLAAVLSNGPSRKLVQQAILGKIRLLASFEMVEELDRVLERDFPKLDKDEITDAYLALALIVAPKEKVNAVKGDSSDDKLFECALEGKAEYIVSYDKKVLDVKKFRGITVAKPEAILEKL